MYRIISVALATLCFISVPATGAEEAYYTWVDENGVTNYSQRDPKEYDAVYVKRSAARFGRQANNPDRGTDSQEVSENAPDSVVKTPDAEMQAEREKVQQEIAKIKESNCALGRRNLAKLEAYNRIRVPGDDGKEKVLSEEEKQQRVDQAQKTISENCTG